MRTVIFDYKSVTQESDPFMLYPRKIAVFKAYSFPTASADSPVAGGFRSLPTACLNMLEWTSPDVAPADNHECGGFYQLRGGAEIMEETPVMGQGCWEINGCNNIAILDVPGWYRFVLSHPDMVGVVSLYADIYDKEDFAVSGVSSLYLGG